MSASLRALGRGRGHRPLPLPDHRRLHAERLRAGRAAPGRRRRQGHCRPTPAVGRTRRRRGPRRARRRARRSRRGLSAAQEAGTRHGARLLARAPHDPGSGPAGPGGPAGRPVVRARALPLIGAAILDPRRQGRASATSAGQATFRGQRASPRARRRRAAPPARRQPRPRRRGLRAPRRTACRDPRAARSASAWAWPGSPAARRTPYAAATIRACSDVAMTTRARRMCGSELEWTALVEDLDVDAASRPPGGADDLLVVVDRVVARGGAGEHEADGRRASCGWPQALAPTAAWPSRRSLDARDLDDGHVGPASRSLG